MVYWRILDTKLATSYRRVPRSYLERSAVNLMEMYDANQMARKAYDEKKARAMRDVINK